MLKYFISNNEQQTLELSAKVIKLLKVGDIVTLKGDLGAGKTTFVKGALNALGYLDAVQSPTFNILKCYFEVTPHIYHIDAYRLENQNIELGLEEYIEGDGICFIEWPMFISPLLPKKVLEIEINRIDDNKRKITFNDPTDSYAQVLKEIC